MKTTQLKKTNRVLFVLQHALLTRVHMLSANAFLSQRWSHGDDDLASPTDLRARVETR